MADQEITMKSLKEFFEATKLQMDVKEWKDDRVYNIGITLGGKKEELMGIDGLLCEASHSVLIGPGLLKAGLFNRSDLMGKMIEFLNEYTDLVRVDYTGLNKNTEYLIKQPDGKSRMFVALEYK